MEPRDYGAATMRPPMPLTVAKLQIPAKRKHFDIVVACEDEEGEDIDVPLVSVKFR